MRERDVEMQEFMDECPTFQAHDAPPGLLRASSINKGVNLSYLLNRVRNGDIYGLKDTEASALFE